MRSQQRQDAIVRSLRRNGTSTIAELAESAGASRRTILRDIGALREAGFVIHSEPGRGGGVQLDPHSAQTATRLSVTEVFALLISVTAMRAVGGLPFSAIADAGLAKLEKALPPDRLRDLRRLLDCLHVGQLAPDVDISDLGPMDAALLPAFESAFLERRHLHFRYRDARGKVSDRNVEPQAMLILPPIWYLVAWDPDRRDFRHFRMDRISVPAVGGQTTFPRRHVAFDAHVRPVRDLSR